MTGHEEINQQVRQALQDKLGDSQSDLILPPPVFATMQGKFTAFDLETGQLSASFPVLYRDLNPYGYMQGGMIAAAVDNTIGPLSVLVAPVNVTRTLEMKYSQPVTQETETIFVEAKFDARDGRWLHFSADVRAEDGQRLARAKAVHYILEA